MTGKRILLTGGTGFIGQELVVRLIEAENDVALVVRDKQRALNLFGERVSYITSENNTAFQHEVTTFSPQIVLHLASYSTSRDDIEAIESLIESNILFVSRLLNALRTNNVELFINAGSFSEFHENDTKLSPSYFYSATKTASRYIIDYFSQVYKFKFVNTVLYSVYGKPSSPKKVIDYIIDSLNSPEPIGMTAGEQILDFIHVQDVCDFYINLIQRADTFDTQYQEYQVGTGRGIKIKKLAEVIEGVSGCKANIAWGEIEYRARDVMYAVADIEETKRLLHWQPAIGVEEGVEYYFVGPEYRQ